MGHSISSFNQCYRIKYSTINGDPDGKEDENQLSAYDIAVIAKHLLQDFPEVTKYTSKPTALFSNTQIENPQPDARRHAKLPFGR